MPTSWSASRSRWCTGTSTSVHGTSSAPPTGLGVTDWESAPNRPANGRGLPVCDLDYFLKYWLHIVAEDADVEVEPRCIRASAPCRSVTCRPTCVAARRMMRRYCIRLSIDRGLRPDAERLQLGRAHAEPARARDGSWTSAVARRSGTGADADPRCPRRRHRRRSVRRARSALDADADRDRGAVLAAEPACPRRRAASSATWRRPWRTARRASGRQRADGHAERRSSRRAGFERVGDRAPTPRPMRRTRLIMAALAGRPAWAFEWALRTVRTCARHHGRHVASRRPARRVRRTGRRAGRARRRWAVR